MTTDIDEDWLAAHPDAIVFEGEEVIWPHVHDMAERFLRAAVRIARRIQLSDDALQAMLLITNAAIKTELWAAEVERQTPQPKRSTRTLTAFDR